jgi:tRNA-specific 2-thiouridylase
MRYFFAEYKAGRTPNPDVMCNKEIKFKVLYKWAMKQGFDYLATGHYARIGKSKNTKKRSSSDVQSITYNLLRSADEFKDQTYFIYNIKTGQLPHLLFPIGGMKKTAVKKLAKRIGLPNAARKESMGLCFVGKIRLKDFLEQQVTAKRGPIVLLDAREGSVSGALPVIGQHEGLHNYTIGQRQGINVGGPGGPYYVVRKDLVKNTLYVTADPNNPALKVSEVQVHSVNWIANYHLPSTLMCRYRHQGELVPCGIEEAGKDVYVVKFKAPQKALASGQSVVFYQGRKCLGGGVIV